MINQQSKAQSFYKFLISNFCYKISYTFLISKKVSFNLFFNLLNIFCYKFFRIHRRIRLIGHISSNCTQNFCSTEKAICFSERNSRIFSKILKEFHCPYFFSKISVYVWIAVEYQFFLAAKANVSGILHDFQ